MRNGYPINLFEQPPKPFPKKEYDLGVGMCWAAVNECTHQNVRDTIVRHVFNVPDVHKERSFYVVVGHHHFESILVAPILATLPDGSSELFGVVCLDSDRKEHYNEADQYLVALAALEDSRRPSRQRGACPSGYDLNLVECELASEKTDEAGGRDVPSNEDGKRHRPSPPRYPRSSPARA